MKLLALSPNYKYHQDVLQSLDDKGVEIEFATSHKPQQEALNREFYARHNTRLVDGSRFYRIATLAKLVPASAPALDKRAIDYFENVERDFYILSDRYSFFPKPFRYRKRLFRLGLRYWLDFFAHNKTDAVFSICSPHNFPDFLAWHVAQYLGIKTLMTTDVMINDHVMLVEDYRQSFKVPADYLAGKSDNEIIGLLPAKFKEKAFKESAFINLSKQLNDKTLGAKNLNTKVTETAFNKKLERFKTKASHFFSPDIFKPKFKAGFAMNGEYSDFTRRFIRATAGLRLKKLKTSYESLAIKPDLTRKYVYFAMHLSPERTTQPEAEIFEDHLLAIEILARAIPSDWVVYVKENPTQYAKKRNLINGRHFRDATDYADFTRLPNVKLIRQDVKSADLISHAAVCASLKGSVGWESINLGKACLVFANAWYAACRSAFKVQSVEECRAAIAEIIAKEPKDVETDKLKFFAYMQQQIIIGSMGGHYNLQVATEPYESQVESLANGIIARLNAESA